MGTKTWRVCPPLRATIQFRRNFGPNEQSANPGPIHYAQRAASVSLVAEGAVLDLISADHSEVIRDDTTQAARKLCVCVWESAERWHICTLCIHLLRCCVSVGHYLRDRSLSGHAGLARRFTKPLAWYFWKVSDLCHLHQACVLCADHRLTYGKWVSGVLHKHRLFVQSHIYIETPVRPPLFLPIHAHIQTRAGPLICFLIQVLISSLLLHWQVPPPSLAATKRLEFGEEAQTGGSIIKAGLSALEPWCPCTSVQALERRMCWNLRQTVTGKRIWFTLIYSDLI